MVGDMTPAELVCRYCKKPFLRSISPSRAKRNLNFYCSNTCAANGRWAGHERLGREALTVAGHPLAGKNGRVFVYRILLYEKIGSGPHTCHWCGDPVEWTRGHAGRGCFAGALAVDHLDGDMHNNDPANLVPSCNDCNSLRGYILGWETRKGRKVLPLLP